MKAAVFYGSRVIKIEELEVPKIGDDEVLVRVKACAICGSDLRGYKSPGFKGVLGHETVGEIVEVGKNVKRFSVGNRVAIYNVIGCGKCEYCKLGMHTYCENIKGAVNNGFSEYVKVPEICLLPLPKQIPYVEGSLLTDSLGTPSRALRRINITSTNTLAVFGLGGIGLNAVQLARTYGVKKIIAVDILDYKLKIAEKFGADYTINAEETDPVEEIKRLTGGCGVDVAVEAVGDPNVELQCVQSTRKGGTVILIGECGCLTINPSAHIIHRHLTIVGSWYITKRDYFENLELVLEGRVDLRSLITHIMPLSKIAEAFDIFDRKREGVVKVVIIP